MRSDAAVDDVGNWRETSVSMQSLRTKGRGWGQEVSVWFESLNMHERCCILGDSDDDTVILAMFHLKESSFWLPLAMNPR